MYRNMKIVPSEDSSEYEAFALEEWKKVKDGIWINGIYISGWLYWHLNHWKIVKDDLNDINNKITGCPDLRDNEWMIAEGIERAEKERLLLCIFGSRQIAKTTFSSSYLARKGTIIEGSQNLIIGASKPDLTNITNDIDFGLQNVSKMFRLPRITRDWKSGEVSLGVKSKEGDNKVYSTFRIRNTEGGKNTEVTAGARPSSALIDEAGKGEFAKVLAALLPGMRGPLGLRAPVLITGTGGDMEKSKDAENMFLSPETNEIVAYVDKMTGKKTGLFMPGWLRSDFKKKSNLAEYLKIEDAPELEEIEMFVSDKERAIETLMQERKNLTKDQDSSKLLKAMMYFPLSVDEVFLSEDHNIFPKDLLIEQKRFLATSAPPVDNVELFLDVNNQVRHRFTDKRPVENYPLKPEDNKEGVIQIWEMPIDDAPGSIYIAATDPYKQSQAVYSDSVGSTYIFKRTYDIMSDKFQNMIVAAYHGRPKKIQTWYANTKMLLKFYNAKTLCENMDYGFIQHLIEKNESPFYLVPQPRFLYDIHPNTTVNRDYGIHMTSDIKNYLYSSIIEYMTNTISTKLNEDGSVEEVLGVRRIIDPMLIEELLKFHPDNNCDRIISFGLVLAYAKSLDKIPLTSAKDTRYQELYNNNKKINSPFKGAAPVFGKKTPW